MQFDATKLGGASGSGLDAAHDPAGAPEISDLAELGWSVSEQWQFHALRTEIAPVFRQLHERAPASDE